MPISNSRAGQRDDSEPTARLQFVAHSQAYITLLTQSFWLCISKYSRVQSSKMFPFISLFNCTYFKIENKKSLLALWKNMDNECLVECV